MSKPFVVLKSRKVLISVGIVTIVVVMGTILMGSFSTTTSAAPNFQLRTIEGNHIWLASFKGKPVIITQVYGLHASDKVKQLPR